MAAAEMSLSYTGMGGDAKPGLIRLGPIDLSVVYRPDTVRMRSAPLQIQAPLPAKERVPTTRYLETRVLRLPCPLHSTARYRWRLTTIAAYARARVVLVLALGLALRSPAFRLAQSATHGPSATGAHPTNSG
jgi:hypothetical protein